MQICVGLLPSFPPDVGKRCDGSEAEAGEHHDPYEVILDKAKAKAKVEDDSALKENDLREVVAAFKALIKKRSARTSRRSAEQLKERDGRLQLLAKRPRDCLSPKVWNFRRLGNGCQCSGYGLW